MGISLKGGGVEDGGALDNVKLPQQKGMLPPVKLSTHYNILSGFYYGKSS